ncbi:MAG: pirin-like C-terminal cupin domain-containing protein, partial [Bdellovibrionota bacterium]
SVAPEKDLFLYVLSGTVEINGREVPPRSLVSFEMRGEEIAISASEEVRVLFCAGQPIREPIVSRGPFVMTSEAEIRQAMADFQAGKMGEVF